MEEIVHAAGLSDSVAEPLNRPYPMSPLISNRTLLLVSCPTALVGIIVSVVAKSGYLPHVCVGIGIGFSAAVIFGTLVVYLLVNAHVDNRRPIPENDQLFVHYTAESTSDDQTPEEPTIAEPLSQAERPDATAQPGTECSTSPEASSLTSDSRERESNDSVEDPANKVGVTVHSQNLQREDSGAEDQQVVCAPEREVEVEQSSTCSGSTTEESSQKAELKATELISFKSS